MLCRDINLWLETILGTYLRNVTTYDFIQLITITKPCSQKQPLNIKVSIIELSY